MTRILGIKDRLANPDQLIPPSQLVKELKVKIEEKTTPFMQIVNPWDSAIDMRERAKQHLYLLDLRYKGGHPGSKTSQEALQKKMADGKMLTWFVYFKTSKGNQYPVGMASLELLGNGIAEAVRSVEMPTGTILPDGTVYNSEANISACMYQRIVDAIEKKLPIAVIESDIRASAERKWINPKTGREVTLPSGEITQHTSKTVMHILPWLLCVPKYQVTPEGTSPHMEALLLSRLYLQPENISRDPLYLSKKKHRISQISIIDIARTTYAMNLQRHDLQINSNTNSSSTEGKYDVVVEAGEHYTTIKASGNINKQSIRQLIKYQLRKTRFVEVIVENDPNNIITQDVLIELGLQPLGVFPGGEFENDGKKLKIPTTIHFGVLREDLINSIRPIALAREYIGTPFEKVAHSARNEWDIKKFK